MANKDLFKQAIAEAKSVREAAIANAKEALEETLGRMKSGSNRPVGQSRPWEMVLNWLNASVGAIMFLNMRSGLLQLTSSLNFINWGDNNIIAAGKAMLSKDWIPTVIKLMNSDYLVNRRDGLKINVMKLNLLMLQKQEVLTVWFHIY